MDKLSEVSIFPYIIYALLRNEDVCLEKECAQSHKVPTMHMA